MKEKKIFEMKDIDSERGAPICLIEKNLINILYPFHSYYIPS